MVDLYKSVVTITVYHFADGRVRDRAIRAAEEAICEGGAFDLRVDSREVMGLVDAALDGLPFNQHLAGDDDRGLTINEILKTRRAC